MSKEIGQIIQEKINRLEKEKKDLIHKNKTYKGLLLKQNKIIDEMAFLIASKPGSRIAICHNMNCDKKQAKECKQCVREFFEKGGK